MKSREIRESFLGYFEKHGHTRVRSASLVPQNDPTLFFTNAGMVQFKETFLGEERRPYRRACSSQKCMRVSGKHNDLENVGHTPRHHTFFEMLGNFSFGDYFKEEAIAFGWEFLTKTMGLPPERMSVTVFREDDEAEKLWKKHVPADRIFRLDEKDNFWAMGETGPCGPCSEIIWDFGSGLVKKEELDSTRFMEIWNLVFMQFNRDADGKMAPLKAPSIDTGMGLERLSAVMQGVTSSWETDLFVPLISRIAEVVKKKPGESPEVDVALRVIADHIRGSVFLIGDGVIPSNEGRGYVLRRIMRRAIRYGKRLGQDAPFLAGLAHVVVDEMGSVYPELATHQRFIEKVIAAEDERFYETLGRGLELLQGEMRKASGKTIPGEVAFQLYDTFGFPLDVTQQIASEQGFSVDERGFEERMESQRERARASWKGSGEEGVAGVYKELVAAGLKSSFVGYSEESCESEVSAVVVDGRRVKEAAEGSRVQFVASATPFYGESGGQAGDRGLAVGEGLEVAITDTKKPLPEIVVHHGEVRRGILREGARLTLAIDGDLRQRTRCNHTTTHLLHRALREVLGEHVKQSGSHVDTKRLRFDFSHFQALSPEELREVEHKVNDAIRKNYPVITYEMGHDEAVAKGALAFFGEKYGERVRMIDVSGFSRELCGGTHVSATGEIGMMKIVSESSVAAGIRRIEAVTGLGASQYVEELEEERREIARALKSQPSENLARVRKLAEEVAKLERELKEARSRAAGASQKDLMGEVRDVAGMKVLSARVDAPDRATLGSLAEKYRDRLRGVVALASVIEDKVVIIVAVSKELTPTVHAGKIVQALSERVGGKGGGRPDFAQGGGTDVEKLDDTLKGIGKLITEMSS
ncbi:MAG TPA: alanine--tRNA ligase [bacterium]|nr:alanine--tRNA ligase [bacterium]